MLSINIIVFIAKQLIKEFKINFFASQGSLESLEKLVGSSFLQGVPGFCLDSTQFQRYKLILL
jgi:hypothetical protein